MTTARLGLHRVDPPAAAGSRVEQAVGIDRVAGAGLRPVDEPVLTRSRVQAGRPPDQASIVAATRPSGIGKSAFGPAVMSRTYARHSGAAAVSDVAGLPDDGCGFEWSLLPIQMPTASAGAAGSAGGAR